ncbi:MAG: pilus assembly PilX N-terminal domain-containing protein [Balneolaceae bacterium]
MGLIKKIARDESGSALITVLIIAVIVSLFIGAVLSGIVLQSRFIQQDINQTKALYKAESGLYTFLNQYQPNSILSDTTLQMEDVELHVSNYGGFWDISSKTGVQNQDREIRVLVGEQSSYIFEHAVAIGDTNSALTLTGSTQINGDVITGKNGVRETSFKGFPFSGSLDGDTKRYSPDSLFPDYNIGSFSFQEERYEGLLEETRNTSYPANFRQVNARLIEAKDTLFFNEGLVMESNTPLQLPQDVVYVIKGNARVEGDISFGAFSKVIVEDTLKINGEVSGSNLLLYSGTRTEIGGKVQLSGQVHSKGEIVLSEDAYLEYPSLLYSSKEFFGGEDREVIHLKDNSVIDGTIVYPFQASTFTQELFKVKVDKQATVRGGIYTGALTELEGKVWGSVLTHQFYFYESPTTYINWLKDVNIDVTQRPENYVLPLGFSDTTKYAILNWFEVTE